MDAVPIDEASNQFEFIEYGEHYNFWINFKPSKKDEVAFKSHAYDYYPRGRIVFDVSHQLSKLYVDRCVPLSALSSICKAFELPEGTQGRYDQHYQCHACNQNYIDDVDEFDLN